LLLANDGTKEEQVLSEPFFVLSNAAGRSKWHKQVLDKRESKSLTSLDIFELEVATNPQKLQIEEIDNDEDPSS
jgi:hypothetical protein